MTRRTNSNLVEAFGADGGPAALYHIGLTVVCSLQVAGGVRASCVVSCSPLTFSFSVFPFSQPLNFEGINNSQ